MPQRFAAALDALDNPDRSLKPWPAALAKEAALFEGLRALANLFDKEIEQPRVYANGEISFNIVGPEGLGEGRPCGQYGETIAGLLSRFRTRNGVGPAAVRQILPVNGWCYLMYSDIEPMLRMAREIIPAPEAADETAAFRA